MPLWVRQSPSELTPSTGAVGAQGFTQSGVKLCNKLTPLSSADLLWWGCYSGDNGFITIEFE